MTDKFCVNVGTSWQNGWPNYFENFWGHCMDVSETNNWMPITVANYQLKELGGKLIQTKTQGWYLRWNDETSHTAFVLRWS